MDQVHDRILEAYLGEMGEEFMLDTRTRIHWVCSMVQGSQTLDVGCSQGIVPVLLAREGISVKGIDIDAESITVAKDLLAKQSEFVASRASFEVADFLAWDPEGAKFDTIVMSEVLEHLTRPEKFLEKAGDLLRDDGSLVVTVPFGINDYIDHKKTYYAFGIIELAAPRYNLVDVEIFGKWVGFRFDKRPEGKPDPYRGWPWNLLKEVEAGFYKVERALAKDLSSSRSALREARKQIQTLQAELGKVRASESAIPNLISEAMSEVKLSSGSILEGVTQQIDQIRQSLVPRDSAVVERLNELSAQFSALERAVEEFRQRELESLEERKTLEKKLEEASSVVQELHKKNVADSMSHQEAYAELNEELKIAREKLSAEMALSNSKTDHIAKLDAELSEAKRALCASEDRYLDESAEFETICEALTSLLAESSCQSGLEEGIQVALVAGAGERQSERLRRVLALVGKVKTLLEYEQKERRKTLGGLDKNKVRLEAHKSAAQRFRTRAGNREKQLLTAYTELNGRFVAQGNLLQEMVAHYSQAVRELSDLQSSAKYRLGQAVATQIRRPWSMSILAEAWDIVASWRKFRRTGSYESSISLEQKYLLDRIEREAGKGQPDTILLGGEAIAADPEGRISIAPVDEELSLPESSLIIQDVGAQSWIPMRGEDRVLTVDAQGATEVLARVGLRGAGAVDVSVSYDQEAAGKSSLEVILDGEAFYAIRLRVPPHASSIKIKFSSLMGEIYNSVQKKRLYEGVSVIIPTFAGADTISRALASVAQQSIPAGLIEIVVVMNGEPDGTALLVDHFAQANPAIAVRTLELALPSVGAARNAGMELSDREYIVFLDDDDILGREYIAGLLKRSCPWSVVVGQILDVVNGKPQSSTVSEQVTRAIALRSISPSDVPGVMTMNAAKLLPTGYMRQVRFNPTLRSGEDVHFFCLFVAKFDPEIKIAELDKDAAYLRTLRPNSVSRRTASVDFSITQRLDVIEGIRAALPSTLNPRAGKFVTNAMRSQVQFAVKYIEGHPSSYGEFSRQVRDRRLGGADCVRWANQRLADTLVFSYCFPPFIDTAGIVMAKRLRAGAEPVDVICNNMNPVRREDPRLVDLVGDLLGHHIVLDTPATFGAWEGIYAFVEQAVTTARRLVKTRRRPYKRIVSRAMWPASHFAAAAFKAQNPKALWSAEFSDPVRVDIRGDARPGELDITWIAGLGVEKYASRIGVPIPSGANLFAWCEDVAFLMADELIFTNQLQLEYMLEKVESGALSDHIRAKSRIVPHPTLPSEFYRLDSSKVTGQLDKIRLAYFGSFYETRGLGGITESLAKLAPADRCRFELNIFSDQAGVLAEDPWYAEVADCVRVHELVGYLKFLRLTTQFDCLIVADAETRHAKSVNPYLPSKVSDYLGSGTPIWAITEPGSSLDRLATADSRITYRSELNSVHEHGKVFKVMLASKSAGLGQS